MKEIKEDDGLSSLSDVIGMGDIVLPTENGVGSCDLAYPFYSPKKLLTYKQWKKKNKKKKSKKK